jgi:heme-degrading monooxygenase HmoA
MKTIPKIVYRVDKFVVPAKAELEFLAKVAETHQVLRTLPGCLQEQVLRQTAGPGKFNIVTIVKWNSSAEMDAAKSVITEKQAATGFKPSEFLTRLGIVADIANYAEVDLQSALQA